MDWQIIHMLASFDIFVSTIQYNNCITAYDIHEKMCVIPCADSLEDLKLMKRLLVFQYAERP